MKPTVLVDTDVLSFIVKNDSRAVLYQPFLAGHSLAISFMTLAELDQWVLLHQWGAMRRLHLEKQLQDFLLLGYDRDLCRWWATVRVTCRNLGRTIEVGDAWIAATALLHDIPLVTHNASDYAGVPNLQIVTR